MVFVSALAGYLVTKKRPYYSAENRPVARTVHVGAFLDLGGNRLNIGLYKDNVVSADTTAIAGQMNTKIIQYTISMVTIIPILCVYPFMQRYFEKGLMLGAVKG